MRDYATQIEEASNWQRIRDQRTLNANEPIIRALVEGGWLKEMPFNRHSMMSLTVPVERDQLSAIRRKLGRALRLRWKDANDHDTVDVLLHIEGSDNLYVQYTVKIPPDAKCHVEEITETRYKLVCES